MHMSTVMCCKRKVSQSGLVKMVHSVGEADQTHGNAAKAASKMMQLLWVIQCRTVLLITELCTLHYSILLLLITFENRYM